MHEVPIGGSHKVVFGDQRAALGKALEGRHLLVQLEQPAVISNSFRDSYQPHDVKGKLLTPALLPKAVQEALAAKGHQLDIRNVKGVGSVKAILIDPRTGVLMGGVSPTGDSYVMAW